MPETWFSKPLNPPLLIYLPNSSSLGLSPRTLFKSSTPSKLSKLPSANNPLTAAALGGTVDMALCN